jgi:5-formyltetrahydrofolate cyclo-ligase
VEIKKKIRQDLLAALASAPSEYLAESSRSIMDVILASDEYAAASTIFTYVGVDSEILTLPLIEAALASGKRICVPKTYPNSVMDAVQINDVNDLIATYRGLLEPADGNAAIVPQNEIELIIVPCLSCDPFGNRIGYGGGYYDRYLKNANVETRKLAVCRKRFLSMHLPHGENDVRMDGYITENRLIASLSEDF